MDFIERLFGISPDGGDGTTELLYIGVLIIAIVAIIGCRRYLKKGNLVA